MAVCNKLRIPFLREELNVGYLMWIVTLYVFERLAQHHSLVDRAEPKVNIGHKLSNKHSKW